MPEIDANVEMKPIVCPHCSKNIKVLSVNVETIHSNPIIHKGLFYDMDTRIIEVEVEKDD